MFLRYTVCVYILYEIIFPGLTLTCFSSYDGTDEHCCLTASKLNLQAKIFCKACMFRSTGYSKLHIDVNVSVYGCLCWPYNTLHTTFYLKSAGIGASFTLTMMDKQYR